MLSHSLHSTGGKQTDKKLVKYTVYQMVKDAMEKQISAEGVKSQDAEVTIEIGHVRPC